MINDIVITYEETEDNERNLRQILRKIENEFLGFNEIVIVGDIPDWIQGVVTLPFTVEKKRQWKIKNKLLRLQAVCLLKNVTDNFLWIDVGDTLFKIDASKPCRILSSLRPSGTDIITDTHTKDLLSRRGFHYNRYLGPYPISFSKKKLMSTFDMVDFETQFGYDIKTLYVNFNRMDPAPQTEPLQNNYYEKPSSYEK